MSRILDDYARRQASLDRPVDELCRPQTLVADSELTITWKPEFERFWERITHAIITGPSAGVSVGAGSNTKTSPVANANFGTITLPDGNYVVNWVVSLGGTLSATDVDNFEATLNGSVIATAQMQGVAGVYPQPPFNITVTGGNLVFKTPGAGTASSVYTAAWSVQPVNGFPVNLQLGDRQWPLVIPSTGILSISTGCMLLTPQDARVLTATFPGDYSVELMGWADVRNNPF